MEGKTSDTRLYEGPYKRVSEILPSINDMQITSKWGGIMPFSADGEPIIGELSTSTSDRNASKSGLYVISGLGGSGMMRGAMSGYLLAQSVAGKEKEIATAKYIIGQANPNRFWTASWRWKMEGKAAL